MSLAAKQRRCRVSQRRTLDTVRRALNSWCLIFGKEVVKFDPPLTGCSDLARSVKELLKECPSPVQEEVMAFQSIKKFAFKLQVSGERLPGWFDGEYGPLSSESSLRVPQVR